MNADTVLWMFPALIILIFLGFPVAFSMMLTALGFGLVRFGDTLVYQFAQRVDDVATNYVLGAIPLFVFMGAILERAGIAERLFDGIYMWTRRLPAGLPWRPCSCARSSPRRAGWSARRRRWSACSPSRR